MTEGGGMAEIVLVHGIAQEQSSADSLEAAWLPAVAGGVRTAGAPNLADALWRSGRPASVDARMAFYGDLFLAAGSQGGSPSALVGSDDWESGVLVEGLANAWLRAAAERGDPWDRAVARTYLDTQTRDAPDVQGGRAFARPILNGLSRLHWFSALGMAAAEKLVTRSLVQISAYFTNDRIRESAQARVLDLIGPETRLVIAHSLGSVIAYEALHRTDDSLSLATLGSPLGLRGIIYDRLVPRPPHIPPSVAEWLNVTDRDDLVAAQTDLRALFPVIHPSQYITMANNLVDNGSKPHEAAHYLGKVVVGAFVISALGDR
jgi:hypothetical protein